MDAADRRSAAVAGQSLVQWGKAHRGTGRGGTAGYGSWSVIGERGRNNRSIADGAVPIRIGPGAASAVDGRQGCVATLEVFEAAQELGLADEPPGC